MKSYFFRRANLVTLVICGVALSSCGKGTEVGFKSSLQQTDLAAPTAGALVLITAPAVGSYINLSNYMNFTLSGFCSTDGGTVSVQVGDVNSGFDFGTAICAANAWAVPLDVSFIFDGPVTFTVNYVDPLNGAAPTVTQDYLKDTISPTNNNITIGNGVTPPTSTNVVLGLLSSGATQMYITNTAGCGGGGTLQPYATTANWILQPVANVATVYGIFSDDAGNQSPCVSATTIVNFTVPTVAITSPAAGALISTANVNAFTVSGTCSENGRSVMLSGAITASVPCNTGAWSASLNLGAVPDGAVVVNADLTNAAGNAAVRSSRTFTKDTFGATGTIVIAGGAVSTTTLTAALTLNSADAASMYITNTAGCASGGVVEPYATTKNWTLTPVAGVATVYVAFSDAAGNIGPCVSDQINYMAAPAPLAISPAVIALPSISAQTVTFLASGGTAPYAFAVFSGPGTIGATTGIYTVAAGVMGTTVIRVTDSATMTADATVTHTSLPVISNRCYNLQIIGKRPHSGNMTGCHRHSIFVPIDGNTTINLREGPFRVLDGNGTDGSAAFSLPGSNSCHSGANSYAVYIKLKGAPGSHIDLSTCATDPLDPSSTFCRQGLLNMERTPGMPIYQDVTQDLLSVSADINGDGVFEQVPLFSPSLENEIWDTDTLGRGHAQIKFCPISTGGHHDDEHGGHGGHHHD